MLKCSLHQNFERRKNFKTTLFTTFMMSSIYKSKLWDNDSKGNNKKHNFGEKTNVLREHQTEISYYAVCLLWHLVTKIQEPCVLSVKGRSSLFWDLFPVRKNCNRIGLVHCNLCILWIMTPLPLLSWRSKGNKCNHSFFSHAGNAIFQSRMKLCVPQVTIQSPH